MNTPSSAEGEQGRGRHTAMDQRRLKPFPLRGSRVGWITPGGGPRDVEDACHRHPHGQAACGALKKGRWMGGWMDGMMDGRKDRWEE